MGTAQVTAVASLPGIPGAPIRATPRVGVADPGCGGDPAAGNLRGGMTRCAAVDLFWIPLGAGGHSVRLNGLVYEAIVAARGHRPRGDLYHAALVVDVDGARHGIEVAPSPDADEASRGVVAGGAVGSRHAGRLRLFRYEVCCRPGGLIPDLAAAAGGPRRLADDPRAARRILALAPAVPTPVWGRDELGAGEMWTSNSVIAWLIVSAGIPADLARMPRGGRAPGWDAGVAVAHRARRARDCAPCAAASSRSTSSPTFPTRATQSQSSSTRGD
jgi:hypothetical protein